MKSEGWVTTWDQRLLETLSEASGKNTATIQKNIRELANVLKIELPKRKVKMKNKKRSNKKFTAVTVRIELYRVLKRIAELEKESVSATVQHITEYYLENGIG